MPSFRGQGRTLAGFVWSGAAPERANRQRVAAPVVSRWRRILEEEKSASETLVHKRPTGKLAGGEGSEGGTSHADRVICTVKRLAAGHVGRALGWASGRL